MNFTKSLTPTKILLCGAFVLVGLLSRSSIGLAQGPWTTKTDMPTSRFALSASVADGKIYAIGGTNGFNQPALSTVEEYDPTTDTWIQKEAMSTGRWLLSTSEVNGIIYAIGGSPYVITYTAEALSTVEAYNPTTNTWTTKTNMPTKRWYLSTSVLGGKIYAIGGADFDSTNIALFAVEEYDPVTDSWTTKAPMPTPRWGLATSVVNGKIYAIGGEYAAEQACSTVEEYDPATDIWTPKANMSGKRTHFSSSVVNGIIYAIGGGDAPDNSLSRVEMYNPDIDAWTTMTDMPTPRMVLATSTVNNRIYAIGGDLGGALSTVEEYDPHLDLLPLIEKIEVDKSYAKPGTDSVCITTKISDPAGITMLAEIEAPDQTPVDSMELFDDGNHNDGNAGDSLYANVWPVNSTEEQHYYVDLHVTQKKSDTIIHHINNIASFTTIGLLKVEKYQFYLLDTIPNPNDELLIKLTIKNKSATGIATNVEVKITSLHDFAEVITVTEKPAGDIEPGLSKETSGYFQMKISEACPVNTEIPIKTDIYSDGYKYWSDTFYIPVQEEQVNIKNIKTQVARIYPNPAENVLNIEFNNAGNQGLEIEILDITGEVIYQKKYNNANAHFTEQFDLSGYAKGVYLIKVKQADRVYVGKIVVR